MSRVFQGRTPGPAAAPRLSLRESRPFTLPERWAGSPGGAADFEGALSRAQRFGHSLDRLIAPSPTAAPPIQRKLDAKGLADQKIDSQVLSRLMKGIQTFNEGEDSKEEISQEHIHGQIALLDAIEREANAWLRQGQDQVAPEARQAIFGLLSQTEEHHTELIDQTIRGGHELWLPESVGHEEQGERQDLWKSLVGETGNVRIRSQDKDFRKQVYGSFAKLLEGKEGSRLLGDLNAPQKDEERRIILDSDFSDKKFRQIEGGKQPEGSFAEPIARLENDKDLHSLLPESKPNQGSGSYVRLAKEAPPSKEEDFQIGKDGEPIHAPRYITLGHELGHARRALRGESRPEFQEDTKDLESLLWRNPEEKTNISETENDLREEHGLPLRKYHMTIGAARAETARHELNAQLDEVTKLWKSAPEEIRDDLYERLGLGDLAHEVDHADLAQSEKVEEIREKIQRAEKDLPGLVETLSREEKKEKPKPKTRPKTTPNPTGGFFGNYWKPLLLGGLGLAAAGGYALWKNWKK